MQLKTKVKVGNITNLSDARYCAGMGVDLLGFPIGIGAGQITPEIFEEIAAWVAGPEFVLEYSDEMDEVLFQKVTHLPSIHHIQVTYKQYARLGSRLDNLSIILITDLKEYSEIKQDIARPSYVILADNVTNLAWDEIKAINQTVPVLLPYQGVEQIAGDIEHLPCSGIVLSGSAEDKPGHKTYDHLARVLESLETE